MLSIDAVRAALVRWAMSSRSMGVTKVRSSSWYTRWQTVVGLGLDGFQTHRDSFDPIVPIGGLQFREDRGRRVNFRGQFFEEGEELIRAE